MTTMEIPSVIYGYFLFVAVLVTVAGTLHFAAGAADTKLPRGRRIVEAIGAVVVAVYGGAVVFLGCVGCLR